MALTLSIATNSCTLGQQLATAHAFQQAALAPEPDAGDVREAWRLMRCDVLAPNGIPLDTFGLLPTSPAELPRFASTVRSEMRQAFGARVEQLAARKVNRALCETEGLSPGALAQHVARGLLPIGAMQAFNRSAATYLEKRLARERVVLRDVIGAAVDHLAGVEEWGHMPSQQRALLGFLRASERSAAILLSRPMTAAESAEHAARFRAEVGGAIEEDVKLLLYYGSRSAARFAAHHRLHEGAIRSAVSCGLLSEGSAMEVCNVIAASEQRLRAHRLAVRLVSLAGMAAVGLPWAAYLRHYDMAFFEMVREYPLTNIPIIVAMLIFGLTASGTIAFAKE